jgi:hypothetical protein
MRAGHRLQIPSLPGRDDSTEGVFESGSDDVVDELLDGGAGEQVRDRLDIESLESCSIGIEDALDL